MHDVADSVDHLADLQQQLFLVLLDCFLFGLVFVLEFDLFCAGVLLVCFFLIPDDFSDVVPLLVEGVEVVAYCIDSVILLRHSWSRAMI